MNENQTGRTQQSSDPASKGLRWYGTALLGIYLGGLAVFLVYFLFRLWPTVEKGEQMRSLADRVFLYGHHISFSVTPETSLILLVIAAGALGSYVHAATSFVTYVGNRRLTSSWVWWYLLRAFVGVALALTFYFVIRGGLLSTSTTSKDINAFGIAAISALAGLCSKQATDKLVEVFDTLFKTKPGTGDEERRDKLAHPIPTLTGINPTSAPANSAGVTLALTGSGFVEESIVRLDGSDLKTEFKGATQLLAHLEARHLSAAACFQISVLNPPPGGGTSDSRAFTVT